MPYRKFALFSVSGALAWVSSFILGGYFFGNIPAVKANFHIVIIAIIFISAAPAVVEFLKARKHAEKT